MYFLAASFEPAGQGPIEFRTPHRRSYHERQKRPRLGASGGRHMHCREIQKAGETDDRLFVVAAWRDAAYFSAAERAALALSEAATLLATGSTRARWGPGRSRSARQREGACRVDDGHRPNQRLEPPQRRHSAGSRRMGDVRRGRKTARQHAEADRAKRTQEIRPGSPAHTP
jgi:hypothetical protein